MHVVKHYDDLFCWKKYNKYTYMPTLYRYKCKEYYSKVVINCSWKNTIISLCWLLDFAGSCLDWVGSTLSTLFLHCCRISTAVLFGMQTNSKSSEVLQPYHFQPNSNRGESLHPQYSSVPSYTVQTNNQEGMADRNQGTKQEINKLLATLGWLMRFWEAGAGGPMQSAQSTGQA